MGDKGFTKNDMDRVGLFQEMEYTTISDKYRHDRRITFNEQAAKGKQMLPGGSKSRSALQQGYFSEKFNRVMEAEAYSDPIRERRKYRLKEAGKNIGKPFLPSSGDKKPSGLGSHYGTLGGAIGAFSPQGKPKTPYKSSGKNIYTTPGRQGTGFGYVNVTIGSYQKHSPDEYDRAKEITKKEHQSHRQNMKGSAFRLNMHARSYFDENPYKSDRGLPPVKGSGDKKMDVKPFKPSSPGKVPAGMKAGTFDPYPSHSADPYNNKVKHSVNIINKAGKTFMPSAGPKSAPVSSIVNTNVIKEINSQNYKTLTSVMSY